MIRCTAILLSLAFLVAVPRSVWADEVPPIEAARRLRNVGIIFTAIGAVAATVAVVAGVEGRGCAHASGEECGIVSFATAVGMGVGAFSLVAPGIPMWIVGDRRTRRAKRTMSFAVSPVVNAQGGGAQASAVLRF